MNRIQRNIPNCVTLLNLLAGIMAIVCAFRATSPLWGLTGWQWGAIFIGIGAVADFFDGFFARLLKAYSELGKELDSLCDLVSFGVAPALLVFNVMEATSEVTPWYRWGMLLVPLVAAFRLARFNVDARQTSYFIGMPVPANAIFWIGFCALVTQGAAFLTYAAVFFPLLVIESWLMVSGVKMLSLKFHDYAFKGLNLWRYILMAGAVVLVFCMGVSGFMWLIVMYIFISLCVRVDK